MKSIEELIDIVKKNRMTIIDMVARAETAHLASSLSCIDVLTVLYENILNFGPLNDPERDLVILSKGHAAPALYTVMASSGTLSSEMLRDFGKEGSLLEEHPSPFLPGVEAASGALGHGLPIATGMALASRIKSLSRKVYVVLGDGECNEGSNWEAAFFAASQRLGNLCVIIDANGWQATCRSSELMPIDTLAEKFQSFIWGVEEIDGHDIETIQKTLVDFKKAPLIGKPLCIVAKTTKGKGVSFMEDNNNWHYKAPTLDDVRNARKELGL